MLIFNNNKPIKQKQWINTKVEFEWSEELQKYVEQSAEGYWYDGEMALCYTHDSAVSISGNTAIGLEDTAQAALNVSAASASANVLRLGNSADSSDDINIYLRSSGLTTFATAGTGDISLAGGGSASAFYIKSNDGVGIGTTSPSDELEIESGHPTIRLNQTGGREWRLGSGEYATGIFTIADSANGQIFNIVSTGNVGIGTTTPGYNLEVAGTFYSGGSSIDYKKHVTDLDVDSSLIHSLRPVSYNYKKEYKDFGYNVKDGKQIGLVSEEVAKTIPELAIMKDGKPKNVDYQKLAVVLLAEVQSLKKDIEELKKDN